MLIYFYLLQLLPRWSQGYNGSPAVFVNRDTICFVCGNNVKFVNTKDKRESVLASPGDGIGALAVNPLCSNVAFAELKINPKLFVYVYPDFSLPRATLEGETTSVWDFRGVFVDIIWVKTQTNKDG